MWGRGGVVISRRTSDLKFGGSRQSPLKLSFVDLSVRCGRESIVPNARRATTKPDLGCIRQGQQWPDVRRKSHPAHSSPG